ncbi:Fibulin-2 [Mytilus edulis]|uniref:Fibulin-2 n=1 Tax=Mytilus edulis TaxID=6550 RepID=A0A8S3VQI9_MYTED|nr:Fibulin-2 [Mytilus edulis]
MLGTVANHIDVSNTVIELSSVHFITAICYGSTSCPNGGTCSSPDTCRCRAGFGGSGCRDINECTMRNGGCNHICKNSIGSYQCDCKNGFYLASDRKTCEDTNECSKNNGDCNQNCKNVEGSYNCFCMNGYKLARDGKMCEDINECLHMTCLNNGSCVNVLGSYSCQCNQGFSGDVCQSDIHECLLSNETCDDQCVNTNGSFYCKCNGDSSSVSGDGVSCRDTQSTSEIYQSEQIGTSMNEYESVVVKEVVKVDSKTGGLSRHDNIQIKGVVDDSGQHRPDRETAEYENLVIFRK